jgi:hypothetical protein
MCFLLMDKYLNLYHLIKRDKKKERFDIILEPLQAIIQLALLSFCPKGSKLTIYNNLLSIQPPGWFQGLLRSYNQDMKEDLFFLFNAIIRFNRFYDFLKNDSDDYCDLYDLLIQMSKRGIDKLIQTYATTEQPALLHTLQLYRLLLEKPMLVTDNEENEINKRHGIYNKDISNDNNKPTHIDDIFIGIRNLYSSHEFTILYQSLLLLEKNPENYESYIQGMNALFLPTYDKIQKWICDNIIY